MRTTRNALLSLLAVGLACALSLGAFSAFSSTKTNQNNRLATGTVAINDNATASTPYYALTNAAPGDDATACVTVTYSGSLPQSTVKLYLPTATLGALAADVTLTVERGTGTVAFSANQKNTPSCTGFTATGTAYSGTLAAFKSAYSGWNNGLGVSPTSRADSKWNPGDTAVYRITAKVNASVTTGGQDTNLHDLTWEAQA